jgi:hypothetical protein
MDSAKRPTAFISYSRSDAVFALDFARELRLAGYPVWLDQLDIPTGARWDDEVEQALRECEIFLIILTPASVSSENVKDEMGYAIDHRKRIMPVLLKECTIPLRLRRFQYVDFTNLEFSEGIRKAKHLLEVLLNQQGTREVTTPPILSPAQPLAQEAKALPLRTDHKPIQRRWLGIGAAILSLAIFIGAGAALIWRELVSPPTPTSVPIITEPSMHTPDLLQTNASSTQTPTVVVAPDQDLFRDNVIQAIQSINSYKISRTGQEPVSQGVIRQYESDMEVVVGKFHNVVRFENGDIVEVIVDQSDLCSRTNGSQWECQSGYFTPDFHDEMIAIVEGMPTSYGPIVIDHGSNLKIYDGKECRMYFLEQLYTGEGYQTNDRYEICFDLVTYFPLYQLTVWKYIVNDIVTQTETHEDRFYDINTPIEIKLPSP